MSVKLLTEHYLVFLSLKGGCTGLSESTLVKIPHWLTKWYFDKCIYRLSWACANVGNHMSRLKSLCGLLIHVDQSWTAGIRWGYDLLLERERRLHCYGHVVEHSIVGPGLGSRPKVEVIDGEQLPWVEATVIWTCGGAFYSGTRARVQARSGSNWRRTTAMPGSLW